MPVQTIFNKLSELEAEYLAWEKIFFVAWDMWDLDGAEYADGFMSEINAAWWDLAYELDVVAA
jgi:hypothetical protein